MELGNMAFGNSRGTYPIERGEGWENELIRLFEAYAPERDNDWREYGEEFENDIFRVMPYWWGDCTCGWDGIDNGQEGLMKQKHRNYCYQSGYNKLGNKYSIIADSPEWYKDLRALFIKHNIPVQDDENWWHGCAVICTCDLAYREMLIETEYMRIFGYDGHKEDCKSIRDNFYYKPTGFGIQWYKYLLRDSYMNQNITLIQFKKIIDDCIKSIKEEDKRRDQ